MSYWGRLMMDEIVDGRCRCKYCKHLIVNLDSSTTQTCWLSYNLVNVEDVCEKFEFSQKLYDGYNKGD